VLQGLMAICHAAENGGHNKEVIDLNMRTPHFYPDRIQDWGKQLDEIQLR
jgi:phosphoheptose isomerase